MLHQVALVGGVPKSLGFKECLQHFLEFREGVVQRRATHALAKATARLHLVEGLLLALQQLDDVVQVCVGRVWGKGGWRDNVCMCVCVGGGWERGRGFGGLVVGVYVCECDAFAAGTFWCRPCMLHVVAHGMQDPD